LNGDDERETPVGPHGQDHDAGGPVGRVALEKLVIFEDQDLTGRGRVGPACCDEPQKYG
jgi:hypothetical protein